MPCPPHLRTEICHQVMTALGVFTDHNVSGSAHVLDLEDPMQSSVRTETKSRQAPVSIIPIFDVSHACNDPTVRSKNRTWFVRCRQVLASGEWALLFWRLAGAAACRPAARLPQHMCSTHRPPGPPLWRPWQGWQNQARWAPSPGIKDDMPRQTLLNPIVPSDERVHKTLCSGALRASGLERGVTLGPERSRGIHGCLFCLHVS